MQILYSGNPYSTSLYNLTGFVANWVRVRTGNPEVVNISYPNLNRISSLHAKNSIIVFRVLYCTMTEMIVKILNKLSFHFTCKM